MLSHKPFTELDESDLQALVADRRPESRSLDYKRDLNFTKDDERRELARDLSSFANASGGDLIYGVEEAKDLSGKPLGYPSSLVGVAGNFDDIKLRIENIARDLIDPRIQGLRVHKVEGCFPNGPIIIVRVPRSWIGPHMLSFQKQTHFFSRNSAGRHPLDVREIRAAFLAGTEQATKIQHFRDRRLGAIVAAETPVPLYLEEAVRTVLHVVPVGDREGAPIDLVRLYESSLLRPQQANSWSRRFNLDGVVAYVGKDSESPGHSYAQGFRDGSFEAVVAGFSNSRAAKPFELFPVGLETDVVEALASFLVIYREYHVDGPFAVMLSVYGARGASLSTGSPRWGHHQKPHMIDRDLLALPEVVAETAAVDPRLLLRPAFDALWQSGGYPRSPSYDDSRNWTPGR